MLRPSSATLASPLSHLPTAGARSWKPFLAVTEKDWPVLLGMLLLIAAVLLVRLDSLIISDMDEGTYLYAGKLVSEGAAPYRDFLLAHPPLLILLAAGWEWLFGPDVVRARIAFMALILASTVPLYAMARAISHSRTAGLLSVASYTTGMLLVANMTRIVRLEPLLNAFLIGAFACYLLRPRSPRMQFLAGALFGLSVLVKLTAVVPVAFLIIGDLLWIHRGRDLLRCWVVFAAGVTLILGPSMLFLLNQPGFVDDVLLSHMIRPGLPLETRLNFLRQGFIRYPLIPIALAASAWLTLRASDPRLRTIGLVALGTTATLVLAFRTFFVSYLVQVLPWVGLVFAVVVYPVAGRLIRQAAQPVLLTGTLLLAAGAPLLYGEVYYRTAHDHVSSPAQIVQLLRGGEGYLYTIYPSFALWSGRELYPWYYVADSLIPRITGQAGDDDLVRVFAASEALVLLPDELQAYPAARTYAEHYFRVAYEDAYYSLWVRSVPREPCPSASDAPGPVD